MMVAKKRNKKQTNGELNKILEKDNGNETKGNKYTQTKDHYNASEVEEKLKTEEEIQWYSKVPKPDYNKKVAVAKYITINQIE